MRSPIGSSGQTAMERAGIFLVEGRQRLSLIDHIVSILTVPIKYKQGSIFHLEILMSVSNEKQLHGTIKIFSFGSKINMIHTLWRPSSLSTIQRINHGAYRLSSLSTIEPIDHGAYQPLTLSTIEPIDQLSACFVI